MKSFNYENPNFYLKSTGHIFYDGDKEYYEGPSESIFVASRLNPLDDYGYRIGGEFKCKKSKWAFHKKLINARAKQPFI